MFEWSFLDLVQSEAVEEVEEQEEAASSCIILKRQLWASILIRDS